MKALEAYGIKQTAAEVGFDLCGICSTRNFSAEREFFLGWLERGLHGGLHYLERNIDKRFDTLEFMPGARSVVVCGVAYKNDTSLGNRSKPTAPKVASYARSVDYHITIKRMLRDMAAQLTEKYGPFSYRVCVDSAPLLEKRLGVEAGLGFTGRNTLLISPVFGSFILLGEIVMQEPVDVYDRPYRGIGCGNCRRCVDKCPSGALTAYGMDVGKCVAGITIEKTAAECTDSERRAACRGWIFGCDECQAVCPYNAGTPLYSNPLFKPLFDPNDISVDRWLEMSSEEFELNFGDTPLSRCGLDGIKRLLPERRRSLPI